MEYRTEELIEAYFSGSLTETEYQELQNILANNPEAAAEFKWQQGLARQVSKLSLAGGIQNEQFREAAKPPFRKVTFTRTLLSLAAALALLFAAIYFIPGLMENSTQQFATESFEHFPNKMKFKSLGDEAETEPPAVIEAFAAYDQKDYASAAAKLTEVLRSYPERLDYRFYQGVALLGNKQYQETIQALLPVAAASDNTYSTVAHYYLGLAYTAREDFSQAKKYLEQYVAAPDGVTFRKPAEELLKRLKE